MHTLYQKKCVLFTVECVLLLRNVSLCTPHTCRSRVWGLGYLLKVFELAKGAVAEDTGVLAAFPLATSLRVSHVLKKRLFAAKRFFCSARMRGRGVRLGQTGEIAGAKSGRLHSGGVRRASARGHARVPVGTLSIDLAVRSARGRRNSCASFDDDNHAGWEPGPSDSASLPLPRHAACARRHSGLAASAQPCQEEARFGIASTARERSAAHAGRHARSGGKTAYGSTSAGSRHDRTATAGRASRPCPQMLRAPPTLRVALCVSATGRICG